MKEYLIPKTGYVMRYHDFPGDDMPILFIHGLGCAGSFDYPGVASQAPLKNHRRILVDLLGAGYSDKPTDFAYTVEDHAAYLPEFITSLNLGPFFLGHSLGGAVRSHWQINAATGCTRLSWLNQIWIKAQRVLEGSTSKYIADFDM